MFKLYQVYIASPFFNEKQLNTVIRIENLLEKLSINYYSPRHDGVLKDMSPEEKIKNCQRIFNLNVTNVAESELVLANIDDRDPGTIFEMGLAYGFDKDIISFSNFDHEINVMLRNSVIAHAKNIEILETYLDLYFKGDLIIKQANDSENVT